MGIDDRFRRMSPERRLPVEEEAEQFPTRFGAPNQLAEENAFEQRFKVMTNPEQYEYYSWMAAQAGLKFHPDQRLISIIMTDETEILWDTDTNPDEPISLNVDVPSTVLKIQFEDPTFIRKVTCGINGYTFAPGAWCGIAGVPLPPAEPQVLTGFPGGMDIRDHLWIDVRKAGSNQIYTEKPVSVTAFCGTGPIPYFWSPIPVIRRATTLSFRLSILPPGQENNPHGPPFVTKLGLFQIQLHCEVFQPFGA